jgi:hypothetical protein
MRTLLFLILAVLGNSLQAQNFEFPEVPAQAADSNGFVPKGWKILKSAEGDLNKDKLADLAMVLQNTDESYLATNEDTESVLDSNYRMTIVAFQQPKGGYSLKVKNHSFVQRHLLDHMDQPFDDIKIERGVLKFYFHYFMSMGSWSTSNTTFIFRWQKEKMALIGMNESSFMRNSGEAIDNSYNFSTMKHQQITSNQFDETVKRTETWKAIKPQKFPSLAEFGPSDEFLVEE